MSRYWIQIVLGAIVVFGLGMGVVAIADSGRERIEAIAEIPRMPHILATIPDQFDPLTIDGVESGSISRVQIDPESDMTITLATADSATIQRIRGCGVLAGSIDGFFEGGLTCTTAAAVPDHGTFGRLQVAGTDVSVPLYAPDAEVSEFHADGHDAAVDIQADSLGETLVRIQDESGNERVHIKSDGSGAATIEIRGDDGRRIFQFRTDSQGVQLQADSQ
jgi:hypothetical protein